MQDHDEIIRKAERDAARKVEQARLEVDIRKLLSADYPDVPQPYSVFFAKGSGAEVWLTWEFPELKDRYNYGPNRPTRGSYFRRARRILEAWDWQTLAYISGPTFTKIQPETRPRDDDEDNNTLVFDGCRVNVERGHGYGPTMELVVWTELPGLLNVGDVQVRVKLSDAAYPIDERPHVETIKHRDGSAVWTEKRKQYPRIEEAFTVVNWAGGSEDHITAAYLFSTKLWAKWADKVSADLGD